MKSLEAQTNRLGNSFIQFTNVAGTPFIAALSAMATGLIGLALQRGQQRWPCPCHPPARRSAPSQPPTSWSASAVWWPALYGRPSP